MALISIDSGSGYVDMPPPSAMEVVPNEIVKSSRNALGNLYKFRIAVKTTINVEWAVIKSEDKTRLMNATSGNSFQVKFFDMPTSTIKYGKFYRGSDLKISPVTNLEGSDFRYYSVSMSLVEF